MDEPRAMGSQGNCTIDEPATKQNHWHTVPGWFLLVLLLLPPMLLLPGLGDSFLWQDEAETALLGQRVAEYGVPLANDGVGPIITDQQGHPDINADGIWIWNPWLDKYIAAVGLTLFGDTAFGARILFVLIGWATLFLCLFAFLDITRNRGLSMLAVTILMFWVWSLIYLRQCRYYAPFLAGSMLHLWGYWRVARGARYGAPMLVLGGFVIFHTFYPHLVAITLAMGLHMFFCVADRRRLLRFLVGCGIIALLTTPFFIFALAWARDYEGAGHGFDSWLRYASSLRAYLVMTHLYAFPFFWAIPILVLRGFRKGPPNGPLRFALPALFIALCIALALALSADASAISLNTLMLAVFLLLVLAAFAAFGQPSNESDSWVTLFALAIVAEILLAAALASFPFFRYLLGVMPLFALASAATILAYAGSSRVRAAVFAAALLCGDWIPLAPFHALRPLAGGLLPTTARQRVATTAYGHSPSNTVVKAVLRRREGDSLFRITAFEYAYELTHDYDGPIEGVVKYLEHHAREDDRLLVTYEHFPFMFHTRLEVFRDFEAESLPEPPDWIFIHSPRRPKWSREWGRSVRANYLPVRLDVMELPWENIPEPYWHRFRTPVPGNARPVRLLKRRTE